MGVLRLSKLMLGLVAWSLLSGSLVAAQGFFEEGGPGGAPETFGTEPSRVGDHGLYKTALVIVDAADGSGTWVDMEAKYAFERTADRYVLDRRADPVWARSFVAEWETEPFEVNLTRHFVVPDAPDLGLPDLGVPEAPGAPATPTADCGAYYGDWDAWDDCWDDYGDAWDAWGDDWEDDWEQWGDDWDAWLDDWSGYDDEWLFFGAPVHRVQETPWQETHHDADSTGFAATFRPSDTTAPPRDLGVALDALSDPTWTETLAVDGPCGYRHDLQGTRVPIWDSITVHGACPPPVALDFGASELLSGPIELRVSGTDTVGDRDTTVYAWAEDADRLRLWFSQDVAYPVRILDRLPEVVPPEVQALVGDDVEQPTLYVMHELIEYEAGAGPSDPAPPMDADVGPATAPRHPWGPDDAGAPLRWPLSRAYQEALADPALSSWAADHPDAEVYAADYVSTESDAGGTAPSDPVRTEAWTFRITDGRSGRLVTSTLTGRTETVAVGGETVTYRAHRTTVTAVELADFPTPRWGDELPSATGQVQRMQRLDPGAADAPGGIGYGFDLTRDAFWVTAGTGAAQRTLTIDDDGRPAYDVVGDSAAPEPRFQATEWEPYADEPWTRTAATKGVWRFPEPKTAAALAGAAAGATLLAFAVASLKAGSGVGLFSRITGDDLLEHPVRNDIMTHVSTDPGIHFQELARRVGKGRGTTEHHVRKLVASGFLAEQTAGGFTCYFPKGRVDRRVMAAAPILKSDGARSVLGAVVGSPGSVAKDLALVLGMAPSTVNYHLKKLQEAGLVVAQRQGRFLALEATDTGRTALGTFAPTNA